MRSNFKSWKSSLWKKAICLKCSTARSEMLPSIFSLPRCTASSKYLSIKWQICTVARELLFSSKQNWAVSCQIQGIWARLLLWLIYVLQCCCCVFHVCERCPQMQTLMLYSGFSLGTDWVYITSSHRAKIHLENMRDVPQPTVIFNFKTRENW